MIQKSNFAALILLPSFTYAATVLSSPPELNNKSYVLMDYETGQILASKNENEHLAPASMTKMMTSYIIEQKLLKGELTENESVVWWKENENEFGFYE